MTEQEALLLIRQVESEEGKRVTATLTHTMNRGPRKAAVQLVLNAGQRKIRVSNPDEWKSIKLAWKEIK